ncbi:MAG: hypothetical protein MRERC_12c009 [Mycoplasmataceae bacterium RC_NB112A]|nr:MAG: hypothetical protein MRERC_12c009 [Mycoplasmataceae bacterium RC_NB112A]
MPSLLKKEEKRWKGEIFLSLIIKNFKFELLKGTENP